MLIKRLYLRNFRVYEDELDLELPPGLVGIYGPNGAGKSTLLEAILFTLWGKSRTTKEQIRSSGVGGECLTELEFEHEGHLYLVRRSLKGINSQVSVEAHCDGSLISTGTRDAQRFIESVLGMDDAAFRASVFTEQKQLAAFSNQSPADRRRLVLQLLGITPLDGARDAARKDARDRTAEHERLRRMLSDLQQLELEAADRTALAEAAEVTAGDEAHAAAAARDRAEQAAARFHAEDLRRQEYEGLVLEGRAARQELDQYREAVDARTAEVGQLDRLVEELVQLDRSAEGCEDGEHLLELMATVVAAARAASQIRVGPRPDPPDADLAEAASNRSGALRQELAAARALHQAARTEAGRAEQAMARSASLTGEGECPTCGQALGGAFEKVQAHRAAELAEAHRRVQDLEDQVGRLEPAARRAEAEASAWAGRWEQARAAHAAWEQADRLRNEAQEALVQAWGHAEEAGAARVVAPVRDRPPGAPPELDTLTDATSRLRAEVRAQRDAAGRALGIRTQLEARGDVERALTRARDQMDGATNRVEVLRDKVRALDFQPARLETASSAHTAATAAAEAATASAQKAAIIAATERERAAAAATRLSDGRAQHALLGVLESDARHRARAADLLSEFRNTVVAAVGPRLAVQAADLFGELTDHEYENIEVDPETYQLQISDGGRLYGLDRFSGSEIDLANLALRVAISEHIHFQSGGSVGLLVLDEVFGPLDEDRKARMLLALERLRGRFRQILVVTHDSDIKEQMPSAIEVVKRPGRRATARVLGD